jgi:hypothetical protein
MVFKNLDDDDDDDDDNNNNNNNRLHPPTQTLAAMNAMTKGLRKKWLKCFVII